jgi:predicted carbohydrate-binding protein with CBM5 and CBM33 domain
VVVANHTHYECKDTTAENKDLKVKPNDSEPPVIINNNTNTQQTTKTTPRPQGGDDKSAYQKKVQG